MWSRDMHSAGRKRFRFDRLWPSRLTGNNGELRKKFFNQLNISRD
jgi:hypothetical protein